MSSDDDEYPPRQLLQPITHFELPPSQMASSSLSTRESSTTKKPYQITFATRDEEVQYIQKLMENCATYDGTPEHLDDWLKITGVFLTREKYPDMDHPYIIRHLLVDDALDYYLAHDDVIFNFNDLRKLLLHKQNKLAPLRTLSSLDSVATLTLNNTPSVLTSTQLPAVTSNPSGDLPGSTTFSFAQSLEDLTQNDIRKTIIEDLQRKFTKFTGDHQQDVIKWLKTLENKFATAGIPATKKFELISQLLDNGALDWFHDNKSKFNNSWSEFLDHFKRTFDSPNRARIALQKLHSYTQSPQQDIRSFCSEMRKLFLEADPQMSSTMKLELLIAKVNATYRLDLLKQKPTNSEEFETMAKDLENTYLVYAAIEQSTLSNAVLPSTGSSSSSRTPDFSSSNQQQSTSYNSSRSYNNRNSNNNNKSYRNNNNNSNNFHRSDYRNSHQTHSSNRNNYSPRYSQPNSSQSSQQTPSQPSFNNRHTGDRRNVHDKSQLNMVAYQDLLSTHQGPPTSTNDVLAPMSAATPVSSHEASSQQQAAAQSNLVCQWCNGSGHSARECSF
jgi:Retrotransposon gag protein